MQGIKSGAAGGGGGGDSPVVRLFSQTLAADAAQVNIDLSAIDMSRFAQLELKISNMEITGNGSIYVNFNGDSTSGNYLSGTSSSKAAARVGIGQLYSSKTYMIRLHLLAAETRIITYAEYRSCSSETITNNSSYAAWLGGGVEDLETVSLVMSAGKMSAGTTLTLYGYRM